SVDFTLVLFAILVGEKVLKVVAINFMVLKVTITMKGDITGTVVAPENRRLTLTNSYQLADRIIIWLWKCRYIALEKQLHIVVDGTFGAADTRLKLVAP